MSIVDGKRITYKKAIPNPLFQNWLEELHEEVKQKKYKLENKVKEAIESLSKYPLPLESGAECAILKGFNKRLCLYLDKRLEGYTRSNGKLTANKLVNDVSALEQVKVVIANQTISLKTSEIKEGTTKVKSNVISINLAGKTKYKPTFRSGGYAILMALLDQATHNDSNALKKSDLINLAQRHCDESFTRPKPGSHYTAWANMCRLLKKGLINKIGHKQAQYSLTELGFSIARELLSDTQNRPSDDSIIIYDPKKQLQYLEEKIETGSSSNTHSDKDIIENEIEFYSTDQDVIMEAHSFDIILIIDKNETSGVSKKNDPTVALFNKYPDLKHEYRSLKVGDFTWIARHRTTKHELVLPYIVERKRMDDFSASIKDGRFHEQKFRLRKCGMSNVIYMVENYANNKHCGLPVKTLMQALANTRIQDKFKVHVTESLSHSVRFLAHMTLRLTIEFKNNRLIGRTKEAENGILMTFDYFNKAALKNKPLSVTDTFIKLLLQLKGISIQKALAITSVYKTPATLIKEYQKCSKKEGEMLLANLRCGEISNNVGPVVSKTIYQFFTFSNFI